MNAANKAYDLTYVVHLLLKIVMEIVGVSKQRIRRY